MNSALLLAGFLRGDRVASKQYFWLESGGELVYKIAFGQTSSRLQQPCSSDGEKGRTFHGKHTI